MDAVSTLMLAQTKPKSDPLDVITIAGTLIGAVVVLTVVVLMVRRKFLANANEGNSQAGLFEELRRMKLSGQLSDEEFNAAKAKVAARMKSQALAPPEGAPSGPDKPVTRTTSRRPQGPTLG